MQSQVLFLLFVFYQNADTTEFIYPAAPFLAKRAGANGTTSEEVTNSKGCDCQQLEILTTSQAVRRKHGELLGKTKNILPTFFKEEFLKVTNVRGFFKYFLKILLFKRSQMM